MLPWITWPVTPAPTIVMPSSALLVMTLPVMMALEPAMSMPSSLLPTPVVPVPAVPIQLSAIVTLLAPDATLTPSTLKRVIIRPRIVLLPAAAPTLMPLAPAPAAAPSRRTIGVPA